MSEVKNMKVEIIDEDHIFVNNKQFVSLKRLAEAKKEVAEEEKLYANLRHQMDFDELFADFIRKYKV